MKTLLVIRHAKSSWDHATVSDFDRPLNDRGMKDAPAMAERMLKRKLKIDGIVSSPAKRAKTTAGYFAKAYDIAETDILQIPSLYHASPLTFYDVLTQLPETMNTVALFSHNPGITEFVNMLTKEIRIDNMPTCSVFAVTIETATWDGFIKSNKNFLFFDFPKNIK